MSVTQVGDARFESVTVRAFKLPLEDRNEDYGQVKGNGTASRGGAVSYRRGSTSLLLPSLIKLPLEDRYEDYGQVRA